MLRAPREVTVTLISPVRKEGAKKGGRERETERERRRRRRRRGIKKQS